jgi:RNA polymerase sigma factor (TIGR02999 family)
MSDVSGVLAAVGRGDPQAAEHLLPLIYDELRKLAAARLAAEKPGQTLQPTALVHEAYVRLVGSDATSQWNGRGHFFAAAAEAMRRILVESARRKARVRHGGQRERVSLPEQVPGPPASDEDVLAVSEALDQLAATDSQAAELVKLHYFAGLTFEQAAAVLGVSPRKAYTVWAFARAWLFRALGGDSSAEG